jgi:hypothetical protein
MSSHKLLRPYQFGLEQNRKIATVVSFGSIYVARDKGEKLAPVVVIMNPKHVIGTGTATIKKFVISTRLKTILDVDGLLEALNTVEQWTKHPDRIESPNNSTSRYTLDQLVAIVKQYLLPKHAGAQSTQEASNAAGGTR